MAARILHCERCGKPFTAYRSDARTCSGRCRKALCVNSRKLGPLVPIDLAERAWHASNGDGLLALDAAVTAAHRLRTEAAAA